MKIGTKRGTSKSAINRKNIEESILDVLGKSEKPISTADIANFLNRSWHTIIRYCLNLEMQGKVFKFDIGRIAVWQIKKEGKS